MTPSPAADVAPLRVGFVLGVTLTKWRRIWGERYPRRVLEVVEVPAAGQVDALLERRVDVCFARDLTARDDLHQIPLYVEQPVVLAHRDHPVAAFEELVSADLSEEVALDAEHPDAVDLVAGGAGVLLVPLSVARTWSRRDLVHRPVTDAPGTAIGLAWPRDAAHPWVEDLVGVVRGRTLNSSRTLQEGRVATDRRASTTRSRPARRSRSDRANGARGSGRGSGRRGPR